MDYYGNDNNGSGGFQNDPFSPGNDPSFSGGWDNGPSMNGEDPNHHNKNKRSRKPMSPKQKGAVKIVALCLVCALLGGLAQPIYSSLSGGNETTIYTGDRTPTQVDTASVDTSKELTTAEIYAKYVNSCVGITVDIVSTNIFGQTVTGAAAGSGFVITEDGYILTNYHVIDGANSIKVTFDDGKEYTATYVGGEEKNDIAVIKVDLQGASVTPMEIGDSSALQVGDWVMSVGSPFGLEQSVSQGIVSALTRNELLEGTSGNTLYTNLIQVDASINPGNSGGALVNSKGQLVGICTLYSSDTESFAGIGFAIPGNYATKVADKIINGETVTHAHIGLSMQTVNAQNAKVNKLSVSQGAYVADVTEGGPAEAAGIQKGDIIIGMDGAQITSADAMILAVRSHEIGDTVKVTVMRGDQQMDFDVTLDDDEELQKQQEEERNQPKSDINDYLQNNNGDGGSGSNGYDTDFLEELQEYLNQRNNGQRTYGFGN